MIDTATILACVLTAGSTLGCSRLAAYYLARRRPPRERDALNGIEVDYNARMARALAELVPAETLKKTFLKRFEALVRTKLADELKLTPEEIGEMLLAAFQTGAGRYVAALEGLWKRNFTLHELELVTKLTHQIPGFFRKLETVEQQRIAELDTLVKALRDEATEKHCPPEDPRPSLFEIVRPRRL